MIYFKENDSQKIFFKLINSVGMDDNFTITTTEFFKAVQQTSSKLMMEKEFIISILMSKLTNVFDEMILIIPMLGLLENGLNGIAARTNNKLQLDNMINKFGRYSSDIESIYKIVNDFKNNFSDFGIFELLDMDKNKQSSSRKFISKMEAKFKEEMKNYQKYVNIGNKIFKSNPYIDEETFEVFLKLNQDKIYDEKTKFKKWFLHNNYLSELFINDFKKSTSVKNWCTNNYINYDTFSIYYKNLVTLIIKIYSLDAIIDESNNEINYIKYFDDDIILKQGKSKVVDLNIVKKLELCLLYGFNKNIYIRKAESRNYHSFYSTYNNIEIINMFGKYLTFNKNPSEIICSLYKVNKNGMNMANIIFNVNPSTLSKYLGNIFNSKNFKLFEKNMYKSKYYDEDIYRVNNLDTNKFNNLYYTIYNSFDITNHLLFNKKIKNTDTNKSLYYILRKLADESS